MAKNRLKTVIRHDQISKVALGIVRSEGVRDLNVVAVAKKQVWFRRLFMGIFKTKVTWSAL